jgi:CheY-like chemotaxis protein
MIFPEIAKTDSEPAKPVNQEKATGAKILVVEDMDAVRQTLVRLLTRRGYQVRDAENGVEALKVLTEQASNQFSLMITDMIMPEMNGRELCEAVSVQYPSLPILVLSAYSPELLPEELESRINFLAKPLQPKKLYDQIDIILSTQQ